MKDIDNIEGKLKGVITTSPPEKKSESDNQLTKQIQVDEWKPPVIKNDQTQDQKQKVEEKSPTDQQE